MNYMFKLNDLNKPVQEFKLKNFIACYKNFFTTTLIYETGTMCGRIKLYEYLHEKVGSVAAGIISGAMMQALMTPFFMRSLSGQMGAGSHKKSNLSYMPTLGLIARGGLLGFCHLTVTNQLL